MNLSNSISSIQAHQTLMNNSAYNIANTNTNGFIPSNSTINNSGTSVNATIRGGNDNGSSVSQTDLSKELTNQILYERGVEANVISIRTQDTMFGSLLDITV